MLAPMRRGDTRTGGRFSTIVERPGRGLAKRGSRLVSLGGETLVVKAGLVVEVVLLLMGLGVAWLVVERAVEAGRQVAMRGSVAAVGSGTAVA